MRILNLWDNNIKVDVLISNDTFPAIHIPIDEANVEDLYATIENVKGPSNDIDPNNGLQSAVYRSR